MLVALDRSLSLTDFKLPGESSLGKGSSRESYLRSLRVCIDEKLLRSALPCSITCVVFGCRSLDSLACTAYGCYLLVVESRR